MTPTTWADCWPLLLELEGRELNRNENGADAGGICRYGITVERLRDYHRRHGETNIRRDALIAQIERLEDTAASDIWRDTLWADMKAKLEPLPPSAARHILQLAAVMGESQCWMEVQRALNAIFRRESLKVDGICGFKTQEALNYYLVFIDHSEYFRIALTCSAQGFFRLISHVPKDPGQAKKNKGFLAGWMRRAGRNDEPAP